MASSEWEHYLSDYAALPAVWQRHQDPSALSEPFVISIRAVNGSIPISYHDAHFQILVNLFDARYKTFLGRTWTSSLFKGKIKAGKFRLSVNQNVYFHTSIKEPDLYATFEVIAMNYKLNEQNEQINEEHSCGWTKYKFLTKGKGVKDFSLSMPRSGGLNISLYYGSPRSLTIMDAQLEDIELFQKINSSCLDVAFYSHHSMRKIISHVSENVLVGSNDAVPGIAEPSGKAGEDKLLKPRLEKSVEAYIEKIFISLSPSIDEVEKDMCWQLNEDRINREDGVADGNSIAVIERKLLIGIHNGLNYLQEPTVVFLSSEGQALPKRTGSLRRSSTFGHQRTSSGGSLSGLINSLVYNNRINLESLNEDPNLAIIFTLEYVLGEPSGKDLRTSIAKASQFELAIRWAAWCPFNGNEATSEVTVPLVGGVKFHPDGRFVYKGNVAESSETKRQGRPAKPSKISFRFKYQKKSESSSTTSLQVPVGHLPPRGHSDSRVSLLTEDSGILKEGGTIPISTNRSVKFTERDQLMGQFPEWAEHSAMENAVQSHRTGGTSGTYNLMTSVPATIGRQGYIPLEIQHLRERETGPGTSLYQTPGIRELSFTPVHAPIIPAIPGQYSGQQLSRAAYAQLYQAGFPTIKDRHGEEPEVVDPVDQLKVVPSREDVDYLKANEIVLQLLAYSRVVTFDPIAGAAPKHPVTVFFSFQFYRFPKVTSERLLLGNVEGGLSSDPNSLPCVLRKLDGSGAVLPGPPGYQVKYDVDPVYLKPGEHKFFVSHLAEQTLHIDVWDGDSLLLVGSCAVELRHLLRQGRSAVQVTYELDVVSSEYIESPVIAAGDTTQSGMVKPVDVTSLLRGRLHLRMANIGHVHDPKLARTDKLTLPSQPKLLVNNEPNGSAFPGGSLYATSNHQHTAKQALHMTEVNHELLSMLANRSDQKSARSEINNVHEKKLARMEAVRKKMDGKDKAPPVGTHRKDKEKREQTLRTIDHYRSETKARGIYSMLSQAITVEHTIYPSLGTTEFYEFELRNPYNHQHTITIECEDKELSVVTNPQDWRHLKMINQLFTPLEEDMFSIDKTSHLPQIFMRPKEKVLIPFKYISFRCDHRVAAEEPTDPHKPGRKFNAVGPGSQDPLGSRIIKVYFKTDEGKAVSILSLHVEPQPHIVNQTFRFYHPEHSFFKKSIRVPPLFTIPGAAITDRNALPQVLVRCSDANVVTESRIVAEGEPHDIFMKAACGPSPQIRRFYIVVYTDVHLTKPLQIWQIYVHSMQRIDVNCIEGQTSRLTVLLRGTQASRLVQCFSSHATEMQVSPNEPFMLAAGTLQEIHVGIRPLQPGTRFFYINVVDIEFHQILRSWLACVICQPPQISKVYELKLPKDGGKGCNKRIPYRNPYPSRKTFHFYSNREDLLQLRESKLNMGPNETLNIGLRFMPSNQSGAVEIMVFINDEDDKNEETFCLQVVYQ